jgi:excisionase family DNA binding protein
VINATSGKRPAPDASSGVPAKGAPAKAEVATLLRVGPQVIREMCREGKIAAYPVGESGWRIPDSVAAIGMAGNHRGVA